MAPRLLTRSEFLQTPAAKKPGASYENYARFVARRRAARQSAAAAPEDPTVAATPDNVLRARNAEAVRARIDPELKSILADTDRAASGIELATSTHARRLEPFAGAARERFGRAAEATAGVSQALADRLAGKGAEAGAGLREKLAAINAPDRLTQEVAGGTERFGTGAANAGFGIDSATLDEIISRGAGAEDFAASLPGIAGIAGVRSIGDVRAAGQRSVGEVRKQVPALLAELMNSDRNRELEKANIRTAREIGLQKTEAEKAAAVVAGQKEADKSAQAWARIQQAGERLKMQAGNISFNQAVKASEASLSQKQYELAVKAEERLSKTGKAGFTPAKKQEMAQDAVATASDAFKGAVYDDKGKVKGYDGKEAGRPDEVLRLLLAQGIPISIAIRAIQHFARSKDPSHLKGVTALDEKRGIQVPMWALWQATLGWTKK